VRLVGIQSSPRGESSDSITLTKSCIEACKSGNNANDVNERRDDSPHSLVSAYTMSPTKLLNDSFLHELLVDQSAVLQEVLHHLGQRLVLSHARGAGVFPHSALV